MKHRIAVSIVLALALFALSALACAEGSLIGTPAPDFEITTLDGQPFRLSEQRGKVVYLNIWATWCPPCVAEVGDIQKLADAHPDELVVIGASVDEAQSAAEQFVAENNLTYPIGMDVDFHLMAELFPSPYIPESVMIAPDGTIASIDIGMLTYAQMEARFSAALGK